MSYLRPKIWRWIPSEITAIESLPRFKEKIKKEEHNECPCRLGKVFISNAGFILNQSIVGFQLVKESSRLVGDAKEPCWLVFRVGIERDKITWSDIVLVSLLLALYCVKSVQRRSFFWSLFSCIWTKYKDLIRKSLYSFQIRTRKNPVFGHFSRSVELGRHHFCCCCLLLPTLILFYFC